MVSAPCLEVQDAARVPDDQGADPVRHSPADDLLGGLVLGLADPAGVPGLGFLLASAVLAPAAGAALPWPGGAGRGGAGAALAVAQVLPAFGPDGPPGHQQPPPVRAGGGVGVDDAQVDPGGPVRVRALPGRVDGDRDLGGHVHVQPPRVVAEGHRPDLPGRVGDVPVQPDGQRRAASRDRDGQHPPVEPEGAVIPADRHQGAPAARVPGARVALLAAFGGGEPGVAVAAQHRPGAGAVEFPERARPGFCQFPAQLGIPGQRLVLAPSPPGGQLQHGAPHVAGRPQQPEHPLPLMPGHPQPAPRGPAHHPRPLVITFSRHNLIMPEHTDKTASTVLTAEHSPPHIRGPSYRPALPR